ncbi:MoxR family ATPase [Pleionea sp. CnH1-48]|uniref:AAA family ATPase n=1 Tax=Pleionea sp. CnH1-48 TaxID=2954494 RepID=UPI002097F502|nr:MoxR family ATPase [Pleionea sp. CnH1-48]MCO7222962.1 MoxR family ATPase [Pleionea sp. CnH1-48]
MLNKIEAVSERLNQIILGKQEQVELAIICLLAKGHLLIEDLPGMGKTTLAHGLSRVFGLDFQRIQFTSDLLPADITGTSIYDKQQQSFVFHKGPIFSQVILADEINRATPKTQSALLEAMEERQVTVEGETRELPLPFFVIATQNPSHQVGTYPLPESQLDRFLIRLSLGYPHPDVEKQLLLGGERRPVANVLDALLQPEQLVEVQQEVSKVNVSETLVNYVLQLVLETRKTPELNHGLSPRAGLALIQAGKASAWLSNREFAIPEDIQKVFVAAVGHRLQPHSQSQLSGEQVAEAVLQSVAVPM